MTDRLVVRVFGPTVVELDGVASDLGRRQVRQLVEAFAAHPDWISADALTDHLWSRDLPANPRKALNVALSRLRSALGSASDRLESSGSGYRLRADVVDVDEFVAVFEVARDLTGRAASDQLGEALALWTATPFADDPDSTIAVARRAGLDELRWFAMTRRTELLVQLGDPELAVAESAVLVEGDDVRERAVIAHAAALALLGRKTEALAVTGAAVRRLREGAGLEPSRALLDTEQRIIVGDVDLDPAASRQSRPPTDTFVGRTRELDVLDRTAAGRCCSVVAEAGTGKSALLDQYAERLAQRGGTAIRIDVAATPERPLDTVARLCLVLAREAMDSEDSPIGSEFASALGRACPELGLEASVSMTRDALVDDLTRFIEERTAGAVVILDDVHWIDGGSADVLAALVRRGRVAIVAGLRPVDDPRLAVLTGFRATAAAHHPGAAPEGLCELVRLPPFTRADVHELVSAQTTRSVDDELVNRLVDRSGGNALFLRLLIERWAEGRDSVGDLPSSILVTVSERIDGLSRSTIDTLHVASVAGSTFDLHTIRQVRPQADTDLAAAAAEGIVRLDAHTDTGTFVHAIVGDACYQLLGAGRRIALHDDLARTLEFDGAPAAAIARHHVAAASLDPTRAVWTSIRAASEFTAGFDWETAMAHLDRAAGLVDEFKLDDVWIRAQLLVRRGTVGRALAIEGYLDDLLLGSQLARDAGDNELFVVGVTELCGHGRATRAADTDERVVALLNHALTLDIDNAMRAELCAASVPLFSTSDDAARGRDLYREAWELALRLDDPQVEAAVISHAHLGFAHPDDFHLLANAADRMTELAGSDADMIWEAAFVRFECTVVTGDARAAQQALDEMRLYAPEVTRRSRDFGLAFSESAHARLTGDLDAAEVYANAALELGLERFDESWATTIYGLLLLGIRREQGRVGELAGAVDAMVEGQPDYPPFRAVGAAVAIESGDATRARTHLDALGRSGFGGVVRDVHFTSVLVLAAAAVAAVGTRDEIDEVQTLLADFSGRMSWNGASSDGAIDGALSLLAEARGEHAAADDLRRAADELEGRFRQPVDSAGMRTASASPVQSLLS